MPTVDVEFAKVSYTLAGGRVLLHDINLRLVAGSITALLGRSGSGKTTLLRMVNGLVMPTAGEVLVRGTATSDHDVVELRRGMGYVIQEAGLFPHITVERNTSLSMELERIAKVQVEKRTAEVLGLVGLDFEEFRRRYPWELSGGQRQRVGLARALAMDPEILLMDEPFGALDPLTRAEMQTMLKGLLEQVGKTVILVTHDLNEAMYLADRVVFLEMGKIVTDLAAREVLQSNNSHVKDYVNAVNRTVNA